MSKGNASSSLIPPQGPPVALCISFNDLSALTSWTVISTVPPVETNDILMKFYGEYGMQT
jgi:hypothetical protein